MADTHTDRDDDWAALSSMADGEASLESQARCLALWASDARARERWRDYHLVGDVLRSQELAREPDDDAALLSALRARLTHEPTVLRPKVAVTAAARWRAWAVPTAAMAGVAAVAGVMVLLRTPPDTAAPTLAKQGNAVPMLATAAPAAAPSAQAFNGRLIRDARLDRYFVAHRQSANGTALQMPGAVVRSVDTIVLEDR